MKPEEPDSPPEPAPEPGKVRRRPGRVRRWLVRPFVWGMLALALLLLGPLLFLDSAYVRGRAADLVAARLRELIDRPVRVGSVEFAFYPLSVEIHDLVIPGKQKSDADFLHLPEARVQVSWQALRRQVIDLEQVDVSRPRLHLQFNPDGSDNLPRLRRRGGGGRRIQLRIGRVIVQDGELRFDQRRVRMSIDARAVWARMTGDERRQLEGLVTAQEVRVQLPDARPYSLALSARARLSTDPGRLEVVSFRASGPDLSAQGSGGLDRFSPVRGDFSVTAEGDGRIVNRLGYLEEPLSGPCRLAGQVHIEGPEARYTGLVTAPRAVLGPWEGSDLAARVDGGNDDLRVEVDRLRYAGGLMTGDVAVDWSDGSPQGTAVTIRSDYREVELDVLLADLGLTLERVTGRLAGALEYRLRSKDPLLGQGKSDVRVTAYRDGLGVPVSGVVPLRLDGGILLAESGRLATPSQDLKADFRFDLRPDSRQKGGQSKFELATRDLGETARLFPRPDDPQLAGWIPTAGAGTAAGTFDFAGDDFTLDTTFSLAAVKTPNGDFDQVGGTLRLRPEAIEAMQVEAARGTGRLRLAGSVPFPETATATPLALAVETAGWPIGEALPALLPAEAQARLREVGGSVTGALQLSGTLDQPSGQGQLRAERLTFGGAPLGTLSAQVAVSPAELRIEQGRLEAPAGAAGFSGRLDRASRQLAFQVQAPALELAAQPFAAWLGGGAGALAGEMSAAGTLTGTLDRPAAHLDLSVLGLEVAGRSIAGGEDRAAGKVDVSADWDGTSLSAQGTVGSALTFQGGGRLDPVGADLSLQIASSNLRDLAGLAFERPLPASFAGSVQGRIGFQADFAAGRWEAALDLSDLRAAYQGHQLRNREPVAVSLTAGQLTVQSFYLGEPGTPSEIFVNGTVGLPGGKGARNPLHLRVQSTVAADWAELFVPGAEIQGSVDLLATVQGTLQDPRLSGQGELHEGKLVLRNFAHEIEDLDAFFLFNRDEVTVESLRGRLGGGRLAGTGRFKIPGPGEAFDYRFQLAADNVSVRYPEGFLIRGDADLVLVPTPSGRQIRGTVDLDRAFYLEDIEVELLKLVQRAFQRERYQVSAVDEALAATALNVQIRGPGALRVRNNVADLRGDVDLTLRGNLLLPVVFGRVEIARGGKLTYQEDEYQIERGLLTFTNPNRIDPIIDLVARTKIRSFDITLNFSGTLERLNHKFTTDAGLAEIEIWSLLATGQPPEPDSTIPDTAGPGSEPAGGSFRAQEFLAGQAASVVTSRVGKLFGFDRFRISPLAAETGPAISGVGVTVGKRLSKDLFVTYTSRPAASSEKSVLQAEWQVGNGVTLVFTAQENNTYAVDVQWEKHF